MVTISAAQPISAPDTQSVRLRTAARRLLRSLNSLGVVVADSTRTTHDAAPANSTAARRAELDGLR